jgi:ABC-type bacteriocin/lantibiotic exporter with double-glycine peptidase domain
MNSIYAVRPFQRLFALLRMDRREILYIYLFAFVRGAIMLSVPLGFQAIINFISGGQVATSWGVMIAFVTIGIGLTGVMQVMELSLSEHIKQRLFVRSALEFAYRMPRVRTNSATGGYLPELVNRFFDTMTVQKGLNKVLVDVPVAALQILLGMILLAFYHPFFIGFGFFLIFLLYLIFRATGRRGMETSLKESTFKYNTAFWLEELGRHTSTFKLAGLSDLPMGRADELATGYTVARKSHFQVLLGYYWSMVVFKVVVTLALLILGGLLVINEQMNIGQFVAAEIVIILVINSVEKVILGLESIYDVLTALEKIGQVTDLPLEVQGGLAIPVTLEQGGPMALELRKVTFKSSWSEVPVLKEIDLKVAPGEKVCLSGRSGAGKSSLLHMIAGLIEPDAGSILIDGNGFRSLSLENVRSAMGDSFTQEEVFNGTIMENIVMGRPWVSEADARHAAEKSGLLRLLAEIPHGLLTHLDPLGSRLPTSLVRRIIITRCIAGKPRLVLFEEDALLLPMQDQEEILDLLTGADAGFTLIAVSNDPKLQRRCDRVVQLHDGRIVEDNR